MVIDDLADRKHDCDFLLDQNLGKTTKDYYGLVEGSTKQYFGPKFALLNQEYSALRDSVKVRDGIIRRALVYFGGGEEVNFANILNISCVHFTRIVRHTPRCCGGWIR